MKKAKPEKKDLTAFFDAAEADVSSDLGDWHGVRRDLRKKSYLETRGRS